MATLMECDLLRCVTGILSRVVMTVLQWVGTATQGACHALSRCSPLSRAESARLAWKTSVRSSYCLQTRTELQQPLDGIAYVEEMPACIGMKCAGASFSLGEEESENE